MDPKELRDKVEDLDDLDEALDLMAELDLDSDVFDLREAKKKLRVHLSRTYSQDTPADAQPDHYVINSLLEKDQRQREKLIPFFDKVKQLVGRLPEAVNVDLQTAFPDLDEELTAGEQNLTNENCAILVAGETSAGKSTLLNLLLGETRRNLLPVAHLSVTSVICELKFGEHRHARAHKWPVGDLEAEVEEIFLTDNDAENILSKYIFQRDERTQRFPYQRVELFWPCEWLRAGVTIVDSPGIGESEELKEMLVHYMHKSFGFIYVINSTNAGGVQADRLGDLLYTFRGHSEDRDQKDGWQFDPRCAIFVVNKWELVPKREREEVKEAIYDKLRNIWKGFSESQVFFISAKQALDSMQENVVNEDYAKLLSGVTKLLPVGLKQRIAKQFSFISNVTDHTKRIINTCVTQLDVADIERRNTCQEASKRLRSIEGRPKQIQRELDGMIKDEIREGFDCVKEHLENPKVTGHICHWEEHQCPDNDDLDVLEELMQAYAYKRIRKEISDFDKENQIFENIQIHLKTFLEQRFLTLASELGDIEDMMETGEKGLATKTTAVTGPGQLMPPEGDGTDLTSHEKVILGLLAPVWLPLGMIVGLIALPLFGMNKAFKASKLSEYRKNRGAEMKKVTESMLREIIKEEKLEIFLREKIENTLTLLKDMINKIPRLIKADKQMICKLQKMTQNYAHQLKMLSPLQHEAYLLKGEIDLMYLLEIKSYDIELLRCNKTDNLLAQGAFASVFKGAISQPGVSSPTPCAIKLLRNDNTDTLSPLTKDNASAALLEETNLRTLQNTHVVKYMGTAIEKDGEDYFMHMIMEFCDTNLEEYIENRECYTPPGDCHQSEDLDSKSLMQATDLAWQLADGLQGIHGRGFVHRDLKPANILMTHSGQIRLADLGIAKSEKDISGTLAGTPLYMAPEVVHPGKYNRSADMFSYGLILWELWHGRNVSEVYKVTNLHQLPTLAFLDKGRPDENSPWCKVMLDCWSEVPANRPSAETCCQIFADCIKETAN